MKVFMLFDYVVPMIVYGENVIQEMRDLMEPTKSAEAPAGIIRGNYSNRDILNQNVIHRSDSQENDLI